MNADIKKRCSTCELNKNIDEFHQNRSSKDGKSSECKICKRARKNKWAIENKDRVVEYQRNYKRGIRRPRSRTTSVKDWIQRFIKSFETQERLKSCNIKRDIKRKHKIPYDLISQDMIDREKEVLILNLLSKEYENGNAKSINRRRAK